MLVDGERSQRRKSAGRLNETVAEPYPPVHCSETPTEAVDPPAGMETVGREASAPSGGPTDRAVPDCTRNPTDHQGPR